MWRYPDRGTWQGMAAHLRSPRSAVSNGVRAVSGAAIEAVLWIGSCAFAFRRTSASVPRSTQHGEPSHRKVKPMTVHAGVSPRARIANYRPIAWYRFGVGL